MQGERFFQKIGKMDIKRDNSLQRPIILQVYNPAPVAFNNVSVFNAYQNMNDPNYNLPSYTDTSGTYQMTITEVTGVATYQQILRNSCDSPFVMANVQLEIVGGSNDQLQNTLKFIQLEDIGHEEDDYVYPFPDPYVRAKNAIMFSGLYAPLDGYTNMLFSKINEVTTMNIYMYFLKRFDADKYLRETNYKLRKP